MSLNGFHLTINWKIGCKNETKNLDILKKKKTFNFDGFEKNIYLSTTFKNKDVCVS